MKLVLTKAGADTQTYDISSSTNRILSAGHIEQEWSQIAHVAVMSDSTLAALALQGYTATISYGFNDASAGDEYSACAPLEVGAQQTATRLDQQQSKLVTWFSCAGVFDMMASDKASAAYTQLSTDANTVKTLLTAIANATLVCFNHCKNYTITYDSEDSLIDSYVPADYFQVAFNESRLTAFKKLLGTTNCKARIEDDGEIHVFVPDTDGLQENYTTGDDGAYQGILGAVWLAQTFTVTIAHTITSVKLKLYRGGSPGTVTVGIRATDIDGKPTGADLCSGTIDGDTLTTDTDGVWYKIKFGSVYSLSATVKYAIVVRAPSGSGNNYVDWRSDGSSPSYTGGSSAGSGDSGVTWVLATAYDRMFEEGGVTDYEYNDAATNHNFFSKSTRKRLVIPTKRIVSSHPDHSPSYTGTATDTDSETALGRSLPDHKYIRSTGNAQCAAIAAALLQNDQIAAERGQGIVPMNCGQEVIDYVLITDSVAGDTRYGNISYIAREYSPGRRFSCEIRFGSPSVGLPFFSDVASGGRASGPTWNDYYALIDYIDEKDRMIAQWMLDGNWGTLSLDKIINGETFARVLSTHLDTGKISISSATVFGAEYDPSEKRRCFNTTPTTPYAIGDLWLDGSVVKRCTTTRASGDYVAGDWTVVTVDELTAGTYSAVLTTDISAGHILLSATVKDSSNRVVSDSEKSTWNSKPDTMDEIGEGVTYARVRATEIGSGYLNITSSTLIGGVAQSTVGVFLDATDGITIKGGKLQMKDATETYNYTVYIDSTGYLRIGDGVIGADKFSAALPDVDYAAPSTGRFLGTSSYEWGWGYMANLYVSAGVSFFGGSLSGKILDADFGNTPNTGDGDTDDLIDKLRDALVTLNLIGVP